VTEVSLPEGAGTIKAKIPTKPGDEGLKVHVSIRPEDMVATEGASYAYEGTVEITEKLGEVTQIYFAKSAPEHESVIAKLPGIHYGTRGQTMKMTADPAKVHLFSNGQSLLYRN